MKVLEIPYFGWVNHTELPLRCHSTLRGMLPLARQVCPGRLPDLMREIRAAAMRTRRAVCEKSPGLCQASAHGVGAPDPSAKSSRVNWEAQSRVQHEAQVLSASCDDL